MARRGGLATATETALANPGSTKSPSADRERMAREASRPLVCNVEQRSGNRELPLPASVRAICISSASVRHGTRSKTASGRVTDRERGTLRSIAAFPVMNLDGMSCANCHAVAPFHAK